MADWSRRLGPRVRFGTFGGLSRQQTSLLIVGVFVVLQILAQGAAWSLPAAIICGVFFFWILLGHKYGMPRADWTLKALAYKTDRQRKWQARPVGRSSEQLPRELGDVRIVEVRDRQEKVGMLRERRTLSVAARLELHSLGLFDTDEQGRRLNAFRRILDNLEREAVDEQFRIALLVRRVPHSTNAERDYILEHVEDPDSPQVASMLAVIDETQDEDEAEFYVVMRRSIVAEDGEAGEAGRLIDQTAVGLLTRMRGLIDRFERADIAIKTPRRLLDPAELARLIKGSFNPFAFEIRDRVENAKRQASPDGETNGIDPWPDARERYADCYEADGAFHATLWMRGFPAEEVGPGWMQPLTLDCVVPAIAVVTVFKPEKRGTALRMVKHKRRRNLSLRIFRGWHGMEEEEEQSDRAEFLDRQADELVNKGASAWFWETYATVSASTRKELAGSVAAAEEACADCGLMPVPMRYTPSEAFTFTLPLCRGLL